MVSRETRGGKSRTDVQQKRQQKLTCAEIYYFVRKYKERFVIHINAQGFLNFKDKRAKKINNPRVTRLYLRLWVLSRFFLVFLLFMLVVLFGEVRAVGGVTFEVSVKYY